MKKVFVYYECNYNDLADDCGACSDIYVFSNIAKAKNQVRKTLKIHTGTGNKETYYEGCDRFVVDQNQLENAGIIVNENDRLTDEQIDILIENKYFTSYMYGGEFAKPFIGPVIGPNGESYTRLDFKTAEHPHHRSVWIAVGDVNGVDFWNEPEGRYGKQAHQRFDELISGPVYARISASNTWTDFSDNPIIDEHRTLTFYNTPKKCRVMDIEIVFTASCGRVEFGATKEAGPLGVRVNESMSAARGGSMINAYGAAGESDKGMGAREARKSSTGPESER